MKRTGIRKWAADMKFSEDKSILPGEQRKYSILQLSLDADWGAAV
ncbi:hypothetical protein [Chitinophaga cymbidii]|nr:hypothetical protein [Chitinophaga cymbidii]